MIVNEVSSTIEKVELTDYRQHEKYGKYFELTDREHILGYDIEIYPHDSFVVFKDLDKNIVAIFHNDFTGLRELVAHSTLLSYNGYYYDDIILTGMIDQLTPHQLKEMNDDIIIRRVKKYPSHIIHSLDCFQQIDVSRPSLKRIEANKGISIEETPVDFNIDRPLTEEELERAIFYCGYDVDETLDIFFQRFGLYFLPKKMLLDMKPSLPKNAYRWNTTTLSTSVLLDKPSVRWSTIRVPEELLEIVPPDVKELWQTKDKGKIIHNEFNNAITFGFGGAHSENVKKKVFKNVVLLDVESLYPNIMVNHDILGAATKDYKAILEERLRIKKTEPIRQSALKLVLNSVYGLLKSDYSMLFNPKASVTVCAIGQTILYDLAKRLSDTCEIVQINTDGVAFVPHNDEWKRIKEVWEEEHNYKLSSDFYKTFIQRDVNNYLAEESDGSIKVKGGDVNLYGAKPFTKPFTAAIIDEAIVRHLIHGEEVLDVLLDNLDQPLKFQYILQAGGTFDGTYDKEDNEYQKVNRVFATKANNPEAVTLYKRKNGDTYARFPNAPSSMFVWNRDVSELTNFHKIVDLNHYYDLIIHKLKKWQ